MRNSLFPFSTTLGADCDTVQMSVVTDVASVEAYEEASKGQSPILIYFWAEWHEPSKLGGQMDSVLTGVAQKFPEFLCLRVNMDEVPDVGNALDVTAVPTFIAFYRKKLVGRVEGPNPPEVIKLAKTLAAFAKESPAAEADAAANSNNSNQLQQRLKALVNSSPVMLFMKGTPDAPRCGFSRQIVEILKNNEIPFASFDVLSDEEVRAGLKTYSDWPTYPQLYVAGEFVGGLDIVRELAAPGNLKCSLELPPPAPTLEDRLRALTNQAPVMLFMKGSPDAPRCGFSRTIVSILQENGVQFSHFDILTDDEVRQGLKTYSDWPTYPQLYVNGVLAGGLDIIKEMSASGSLKEQLGI